jgi:hypothetical protein
MMFALFPCSPLDAEVECRVRDTRCRRSGCLPRFVAELRASRSKAAIALSILFRSFLNSAKTCSIFKRLPQGKSHIPITNWVICNLLLCFVPFSEQRRVGPGREPPIDGSGAGFDLQCLAQLICWVTCRCLAGAEFSVTDRPRVDGGGG